MSFKSILVDNAAVNVDFERCICSAKYPIELKYGGVSSYSDTRTVPNN